MDIQLKRGLVEICVLSAMLRGPTYGYQLIKDISPYMEISESTLYPILKRLEASGCVIVRSAEHNGRLRKYYDITPQGRSRTFIISYTTASSTDISLYSPCCEPSTKTRALPALPDLTIFSS